MQLKEYIQAEYGHTLAMFNSDFLSLGEFSKEAWNWCKGWVGVLQVEKEERDIPESGKESAKIYRDRIT